MSDIILAVFTGIISIGLFIYVSFTVRCKGPILSNTYLFASKEERNKIKIKEEYHMVSIVFGLLATIFAFLTVYIITEWAMSLYIVFVLFGCVVVYAIIEAVKSLKSEKK